MTLAGFSSGSMRDRYLVQRLVEKPDEHGQRTGDWTTQGTVWGSPLISLTGGESDIEDQTAARATYRVRMMFFKGLSPKYRLIGEDSGVVLGIIQVVDPDGKRMFHEVTVKAVA